MYINVYAAFHMRQAKIKTKFDKQNWKELRGGTDTL